jgi:cell division topological specificity factor
MMEFFRKLFAPEPSSATARERLRLVLLSDHLSLAPDVVESLRADLIAVISKYVEVDEQNCDVSFEQQDRAVAVLANIPILALRDRRPPPAAPPSGPPPPPEPPPVGDVLGATYAIGEPSVTALSPAAPASGPGSRRRRRRRRGPITPAPAAS